LNNSRVRYVLLGLLLIAALVWWRVSMPKSAAMGATPVIEKLPTTVETHTFDPLSPPMSMPPLSAMEAAVTDSNFISNASVLGESARLDAAHATVTVTGVRVTLQLKINIWVPTEATQHVVEHEEGHRQISEYYYRSADQIATQIAAGYIGKKFQISGADLDGEVTKLLQKLGAGITHEYNDKVSPGVAQQAFDDITDHSRNDVAASAAVAEALRGH
jgi:hypothetical protein